VKVFVLFKTLQNVTKIIGKKRKYSSQQNQPKGNKKKDGKEPNFLRSEVKI
jgi:hypothetical protein